MFGAKEDRKARGLGDSRWCPSRMAIGYGYRIYLGQRNSIIKLTGVMGKMKLCWSCPSLQKLAGLDGSFVPGNSSGSALLLSIWRSGWWRFHVDRAVGWRWMKIVCFFYAGVASSQWVQNFMPKKEKLCCGLRKLFCIEKVYSLSGRMKKQTSCCLRRSTVDCQYTVTI